jgi:hypothetical protein
MGTILGVQALDVRLRTLVSIQHGLRDHWNINRAPMQRMNELKETLSNSCETTQGIGTQQNSLFKQNERKQ